MRRLMTAAVAFGAALAGFADDLTITEAGTRTLAAPATYGALVNNVASGEVRFDQTEPVEAQALSFASLDAVGGASTAFAKGWWTFGGGNFFTTNATASSRMTVFDGAVVTNVGAIAVAGTSGADNRLALTNGASLFCESMLLGRSASQPQRSVVSVSQDSHLVVTGDLAFTEGSAKSDTGKSLLSGNALEVAGENASVSVGGTMSLGWHPPTLSSTLYYVGTVGGNRLSVTDGATADVAKLQVGVGVFHGQSNRVEFARGAKANIGSTGICSSYTTTSDRRGGNEFHVLDGAVVTNTGSFAIGYFDKDATGNYGNRLVVSNATFWTSTFAKINTVDFMLRSSESSITVSGKDAQFGAGNASGFTRALFQGRSCSFIVENGATQSLDFLGTWGKIGFSYTGESSNETIRVRTGATLTTACSLRTGATGADNSYKMAIDNKIVVESDATLHVQKGHLSLYGLRSGLVVDDATVHVEYGLEVGTVQTGGGGTNCYMQVRGSHPYVLVEWGMTVTNDSEVCFALPAKGYDDGYATAKKPVVLVGTAGNAGVTIGADSRIVLTGAMEMLADHKAQKKRATYTLMYSKKGIAMADGYLEELQASLPGEKGELTLALSEDKKTLSLTVKPRYGLILIVR